jgi:cell division protein ZapA (FtsZ GTPase activity inhibitor)
MLVNTMQKHLKVMINGKQYAIATDEDENDVFTAAQHVETLLKAKTEKLPAGSEDKAALAIALQLATDLAKNQRLFLAYEQRIEQLLALLPNEA